MCKGAEVLHVRFEPIVLKNSDFRENGSKTCSWKAYTKIRRGGRPKTSVGNVRGSQTPYRAFGLNLAAATDSGTKMLLSDFRVFQHNQPSAEASIFRCECTQNEFRRNCANPFAAVQREQPTLGIPKQNRKAQLPLVNHCFEIVKPGHALTVTCRKRFSE